MGREALIVIAGRTYPMRFTIGASKAVADRFGGLKELGESMFSGQEMQAIDSIIFITELLIKQGCAYRNLFMKNEVIPEGMPVDESGNVIPITKDEIEIGLGIGDDMQNLMDKINETIYGPKERKVEAEETKTKNPEAT